MEYAEKQGVKSFPTFGRPEWHKLLHDLAKNCGSFELFPEVIGEFDKDGSFPKCKELSNITFSLQYICDRVSPGFERVILSPDAFQLPQLEQLGKFKRHPRFDEAVRVMYVRASDARQFPGFLARR